jgi:mono/diheme cytochrome c family protein
MTSIGAAAGGVYVASELRLARVRTPPARRVEVRSDPAALERGRHLAVHVALCTWCHGDDLGGKETADDPWVGRLHASNLTSGEGGAGARYSDTDFARAIRWGVTPDGRSLLLMPSHYFNGLSDADVGAIIAWLRTAPPVDSQWPDTWAGPLTRVALVAGLAPELISAEQIDQAAVPATGDTEPRDLGADLVDLGSCRVCHHPDLSGGLHPLALPGEPPPPDLRASGPLSTWSAADFVRAMRTGVTPDGRHLSHEYMPWPQFAGMTDHELDAIWSYLRAPEGPH